VKQPVSRNVPIVATGLDRIALGDDAVLKHLVGRRIGLLAHPASVDARLKHAIQVLTEANCSPKVLFGPEHGLNGEAQDMVRVESAADPCTGLPRYSLYGDSEADLKPRAEWLSGLDAIVIDLQDVGSRYYTFIWTAALMLRAAAACGIETIVIDRPNPLGGCVVEGAPQRPGYRSFVGLYDIAVRHGMTIGEICNMARRIERLDDACLKVITMKHWRRDMLFSDTGLPWVMPSPNMPSVTTARVYPGGCLLEGTNLSEGRGTTRPFEIWGAPFIDGNELARHLQAEGVTLRPLNFVPTFHKYAGQLCGGVQVHVTDASAFRPYHFYLQAVALVRERYREALTWRTETYEFVTDRPAIDLLSGGPEFRETVDAYRNINLILEADKKTTADFDKSRQQDLLYSA
jgi:uncharacterized protein YbbC (DUF1343 family)